MMLLEKSLKKVKKANDNVKITVDTLAHASEGVNKLWEAQVVNKANQE